MRIVTWNVNGYRSCLKKGFLDWLGQDKPDIIGLQEVRVLPEQLQEDEVHPKSYTTLWNPAERKGYSGTALMHRGGEEFKFFKGLGEERFDIEGRVSGIECEAFTLFNIYFPNGGRDLERVPYKLDFYRLLLKKVKALHKKGRSVIIMGDFNTCHREIDLARPKENVKNTGFLPEEREMIDLFVKEGLVDTFRNEYPDKEGAYSWWSQRGGARQRNVGWRLDYFLVSESIAKQFKKNKIQADTMGSDHCPVEVTFQS